MDNQAKALRISDLDKVYPGGVVALDKVNFEVEEGDFHALLGPNGAGKSTTIGIIASLVKKTAGQVWIYQHDIDREHNLAKKYIGYVPQEFNFNIFETPEQICSHQARFFGMSRSDAVKRSRECLKLCGLTGKAATIVKNLSGGMKRRLLIARALVHKPKLIILDEPTAGVDLEVRGVVWDTVRELNRKGSTIILTTHYLEEAEQLCRKVTIINQGKVVIDAPISEAVARLGAQDYEVTLDRKLVKPPKLNGFEILGFHEHTLSTRVSGGRDVSGLVNSLENGKLRVVSIKPTRSRLEELFRQITR